MKYKIIPNDIVKNIIEFLDEIQLEAAQNNTHDDLHKINFCDWIIGELVNSTDGYDIEDRPSDSSDRWDTIDKYRRNLKKDFPEEMSEKEFKKLIKSFDAFVEGWDKEYKKSNHKKEGEINKLEEFERSLRIDQDLSPEEKFELYYDEYRKRKDDNESISLEKALKQLGINKPNKSKDK